MGHDHRPVHQRISFVLLLHLLQVQILEVPIVEEKGFVLVEGYRAALRIIEDMHRVARELENIGTIYQETSEGGDGRCVGSEELGRCQIVGCREEVIGKEYADWWRGGWLGVTIRVRFFDVRNVWGRCQCVRIMSTR